ncbi:MAG: ArsR family transcriptional regulator [Candidatus Thorarchaeota archaeon]|nr:ArsR family transcriptional regulator [Candidatus Thorarchaeota archaeon]
MFDDMDDFDWDDEFDSDEEEDDEDDPHIEKLEEIEDELMEQEDELMEHEDEIMEKEDDIRDRLEYARESVLEGKRDAEDEIEDLAEELEDVSEMRRELEEIRRMKEELRREIEGVRRDKEVRLRAGSRISEPRPVRPIRPPKAPRAPRAPRRALNVDFSALTDDLEDMMEGLGEQIEMGLKSVGDLKFPHLRISTKGKNRRSKSKRRKDYENIPPERIAHVIGPLGGEERLKILNFLKEGGKTFKELEEFTGKAGSSLTHHLSPLVEAGYVIKGEVRGTYYVTVEGRLAYRLAQWLTNRLEEERTLSDVKKAEQDEVSKENNGSVSIQIEDDEEDDF